MQLSYRGIVKRERKRSEKDRRKMVLSVVAEYSGADKEIYRKSFEVTCSSNSEPIVPMYGTHEQLNAAKYQWASEGLFEARMLK